MTTVQQDARAVRTLRLKAVKLKLQYEEAEREFKRTQQALYDRMVSEDMPSFKHGNVTYTKHSTEFGQVQDADAFKRWCDEEGEEDFFQPTPRKKLINELVRERIRNSQPLPPGIGFYTNDYVSQTAKDDC